MAFLPDYRVEIEEMRDLGDIVLVRSLGTGHGAASDTPVHDCAWWRNCSTEAEALEAIEQRTGAVA